MTFEFNYRTKDNVFDVEIDMGKLIYTPMKLENNPYPQSKNITVNIIHVYNRTTFAMSSKSLYLDKNNRLYFKGKRNWSSKTTRYFIDELIKIKEKVENDNK